MTFSAIARCKRTGQFGVGIATYSPNVGMRCPIAVPGYGAATIQAVANPIMLAPAARMLENCYRAAKVVRELQDADSHPEYRQICVVDVNGGLMRPQAKRTRPGPGMR